MTNEINHEILDAYWFPNGGIVLIKDKFDGIKCYIKGLESMVNENDDSKRIMDWGNTFPLEAAITLFPQYAKEIEEQLKD